MTNTTYYCYYSQPFGVPGTNIRLKLYAAKIMAIKKCHHPFCSDLKHSLSQLKQISTTKKIVHIGAGIWCVSYWNDDRTCNAFGIKHNNNNKWKTTRGEIAINLLLWLRHSCAFIVCVRKVTAWFCSMKNAIARTTYFDIVILYNFHSLFYWQPRINTHVEYRSVFIEDWNKSVLLSVVLYL